MPFELAEMEAISRARGRILRVVHATTLGEIDAAFAAFQQHRIGGLVLGSDPLMADEGERLAALAARLAVPTVYPFREHAEQGGLICVGTSVPAAYRLAGALTARILKGAKPGDLPVQQPTTVEVIVNLRTAKAQGLEIPESLLARADEVIE
jgi:putative ABC transport system substrate-binding protein